MPHGRTHNLVNTLLTAATFAGAKYYGVADPVSLSMSAGVMVGFVLNPDLDVESGSIAYHNVRRLPIVGKALAIVWRIAWWPYAKVMPHRSSLSHFPVLGTLIRVSYLGLLSWPTWPFIPWGAVLPWLAPALLGLALSDTVHWVLDMKALKVFTLWARTAFLFALLGLLAWWLLVWR